MWVDMSKCGETSSQVMVFQFCTVMDSTSENGENYESDDDDRVGEFDKYVWVPGELKLGLGYPEQRSALDYQDTLVSFKLP